MVRLQETQTSPNIARIIVVHYTGTSERKWFWNIGQGLGSMRGILVNIVLDLSFMITKLPVKFHRNRLRTFWDMAFWNYLLNQVCYLGDSCQHRTWPSFYDNQTSCQISSKSVENFLSYLDHRKTIRKTERQTDSHE